MTPSGRGNLESFFRGHNDIAHGNYLVTVVGRVGTSKDHKNDDSPYVDIVLPPARSGIYPGAVLNALSEVDYQVGGMDKPEPEGPPPVGRVTLRFVTTFNSDSGGLGMTFVDTDASLRSGWAARQVAASAQE